MNFSTHVRVHPVKLLHPVTNVNLKQSQQTKNINQINIKPYEKVHEKNKIQTNQPNNLIFFGSVLDRFS